MAKKMKKEFAALKVRIFALLGDEWMGVLDWQPKSNNSQNIFKELVIRIL